MAQGLMAPSLRADVDGNGVVDSVDATHIEASLTGAVLPGWWNHLSGRTERNAWVDRFLMIEETDKHPYTYWFQCANFALQTFIHGAFYRGDLFFTRYNGGQTIFNLPLYEVGIMTPSFSHNLNAILVGDDPLNFEDWRFFEPQNDGDAKPGMWDMPYGSTVRIGVPGFIQPDGFSDETKVIFYVDQSGWVLQEFSPDLILVRPPRTTTPDNRADAWRPRMVPVKGGMVLFERTRTGMSPLIDIHLGQIPIGDSPEGTPLTLASQYSHLLDVFHGTDGTVHLLWAGKQDYVPGMFYGRLDHTGDQITGVTRVSQGARMIREGRVLVAKDSQVHVFWLEAKRNIDHPYDTGIYWTHWTGSAWNTPQNLTPGINLFLGSPTGEAPDFIRCAFDVAVSGDGRIVCLWTDHQFSGPTIREISYEGSWTTASIIEEFGAGTTPLGLSIAAGSMGSLHLVYWTGSVLNPWGNLMHRRHDGISWSSSETVDGSGLACCPHITQRADDSMVLIWAKKAAGIALPVWSRYQNGKWGAAKTLDVRSQAEAWYPRADLLADGSLVFCWSSRSQDRVTLETVALTNHPPSLSGNAADTAFSGILYSFTPLSIDEDGDTLAFSITNKPQWANFDATTGTLAGTPSDADMGTTTGIVISVTDCFLSSSLPAFNLNVLPLEPTVKGDMDGDKMINLADAIIALKVLLGAETSSGLKKEADANGDAKMGSEEAIYILQRISGLR